MRTLFVSGLPLDIKPRELYLLFRPFKVPDWGGERWGWKRGAGPLPHPHGPTNLGGLWEPAGFPPEKSNLVILVTETSFCAFFPH